MIDGSAFGRIMPSRFLESLLENRFRQATHLSRAMAISGPGWDIVGQTVHAMWGDRIQVYSIGERCLLELGGNCLAGETLRPDANGCGVVDDKFFAAVALQAGGKEGLIRVQIVKPCFTPLVYPDALIHSDWLEARGHLAAAADLRHFDEGW